MLSDRILNIAIVISIALHAVVLCTRFTFPDAFEFKNPPPIEVVLVNSKSAASPERPDVLAQANLDGGGNTDENRRAKTPLPATPRTQTGTDLVEQTKRQIQQLEQKQHKLLMQAAKAKTIMSPTEMRAEPFPSLDPVRLDQSGQDAAARALAMAKLEAQIARQVDEYNKRPRKQFVGARAAEVRFAQYVEDWRLKIERVGNANYPAAARGRIYGSLRLTVAIRADGSVESIEVDQPSGYQMLNRAAERIVKMASPYSAFPTDVRRDTDILVITRTWIFAPGDKLQSE
ncbi:MAG: TonB family protein [Betaproteobacteria bacterium]|nr:TonB family protein [Betaproteobacteria bacterium]